MKTHLNTLFVTTQGAYLRKDGETVDVRVEKKSRLRVPLHNLAWIKNVAEFLNNLRILRVSHVNEIKAR